MSLGISAQSPESVSVGTTALTVFGASNWTGSDGGSNTDRAVQVTNCGDTDLYVRTVVAGAGATVMTTNFERVLASGDPPFIFAIGKNQSLQVIRASGSGIAYARRIQ